MVEKYIHFRDRDTMMVYGANSFEHQLQTGGRIYKIE